MVETIRVCNVNKPSSVGRFGSGIAVKSNSRGAGIAFNDGIVSAGCD